MLGLCVVSLNTVEVWKENHMIHKIMKHFELSILCMGVGYHRRKQQAHKYPISLYTGLATKSKVRRVQDIMEQGQNFLFEVTTHEVEGFLHQHSGK
jgi:hypothetical protein